MAMYQSEILVPWEPMKRTVPMKVLIVGAWRTGTSSLLQAFQDLGYHNTYPRISPGANTWNSFTYTQAWNKVIDEKFVFGKNIGRTELDELLGDCMVVSGVPCQLFLEEMLAAYPDAKVILTTRNIDAWHRSILGSFDYISTRPIFRVASIFSPWIKTRQAYLDKVKYWGWFNNISAYGKLVYQKHVDKVRLLVESDAIPEENYIELEVGHGWDPLCEFLGVGIPKGAIFPRVNDQAAVHFMFSNILIPNAWWVVVKGLASYILPIVTMGAFFWMWRNNIN